ncbi:uncharacterized protein LOC119072191 [Bradysia coprophila]|uniref:uncharacterized protein LOC119072191 n=1 Tax=Bradysia coprophila TaxID=38358 RepID=UPI00187D75A0|nr:uncharacterized protein LOC119072191 [Bradysia coprophila]
MSTLLFYLTIGVCVASIAAIECDVKSYHPAVPYGYPQQIFWDNRTNSIFFADASAPKGSDSLHRFDWDSKTLYSAKLTDSVETVSFILPVQSSPSILIAGQGQSILRVQWDGVSREAKIIDVITTFSPGENNAIDRGATSPDGTVFMSVIPSTYCKKNVDGYPESSIVYLDLGSRSARIKSALKPGTYSNGIYFDAKTDICYVSNDCTATVTATKWNRKSNTLENIKPSYKFDPATARTDYPAGLTVDQCSNFYVGDFNSGLVYHVNSKTSELIRKYKVPGTHVTSVGFVGPNLDYLCVVTGREYHDSYGGSKSSSLNPGDGNLHLIPISPECCNNGCKGHPGVPVCGL